MGFRQIRAPTACRNPAPPQHLSCSDPFHSMACERNCSEVCKAFAACICCYWWTKITKELLPGEEKPKIPPGGKRKTQEERGSGAGGVGPPLGPGPCSEISQARHRHRVWPSLVIPPCAAMHPHTWMIFTRWGLSLPFWAFGVWPREGLLKAASLTLLPSD